MANACGICDRELDQKIDPLSVDCGGACWGCLGEIEADMGNEYSLAKIREQFAKGFCLGWVDTSTKSPAEDRK